MFNADDLIALCITAAEVEEGRKPAGPLAVMVAGQSAGQRAGKARRWTPEEEDYLLRNLGYQTDEEMGAALGRTAVAVHIHWDRDMNLGGPSSAKNTAFLTGRRAAQLTGLDQHKITHWCDVGLIQHRIMAGDRRIHLISRLSFTRFIVNPDNWIYFDWQKLTDAHLRRLCELRAARWGDEWWTTRQVADYHGVRTEDVSRLVKRGEIKGVHLPASRSGRHKQLSWANWYVKKSDALKARFYKPGQRVVQFTARAETWMLKAHDMGWNHSQICRSMGNPCHSYTLGKYLNNLLAARQSVSL